MKNQIENNQIKIAIKNFRTLKDCEFIIQNGINCFVGFNDSGKSNLIDAIKLISNKYRPNKDDFLTTINEDDSKFNKQKRIDISCQFNNKELDAQNRDFETFMLDKELIDDALFYKMVIFHFFIN